jgi:small-conductance mechanosensitive channel
MIYDIKIKTYINMYVYFRHMIEEVLAFLSLERIVPIIRTLVVLIVFLTLFNFLLSGVKKMLLKRAKTKRQISNIKIFTRLFRYVTIIALVLFAVFTYAGSWTGLGISVGLFSAALGWALQRPITGIAGWMMVILKRPFDIGDRIIIGNVRGDVVDITLTHIYIGEIGGIVAGEENSGRTIMVPNSKLFEQDITNYTADNDYVLDQVGITIKFKSNLDKAAKLCVDAAKKHTKDVIKKTGKQPYVRYSIQNSGMDVRVRFFAPAKKLQEVSTRIYEEIFKSVKKTKGVEFAYPHHQVYLKK